MECIPMLSVGPTQHSCVLLIVSMVTAVQLDFKLSQRRLSLDMGRCIVSQKFIDVSEEELPYIFNFEE
jgi:hypothetical protein